jgi:superfamily II DNA or RNA helicase
MFQLEQRDYQNRIHQKAIDYLETPSNGVAKTVLIESPTGSGKTVMALNLAKYLEGQGHTIGFVAHRRELLFQAEKTNIDFFGCKTLKSISLFNRTPEQFKDRTVIIVDECLPADTSLIVEHEGEIVLISMKQVISGMGDTVLSQGKSGLEFNKILSRTPMGSKEIYEVTINTAEGVIILPITAEGRIFADGYYCKVKDLQIGQKTRVLAACWPKYRGLQGVRQNLFIQPQITTNPNDYLKTGTNYPKDEVGRRKSENQNILQENKLEPNVVQIGIIIKIVKTGLFTETYDIGVNKVHNFYADGVLIHNCQHDASKSASILHDTIRPEIIIGLTATPYRTDKAQLCFQKVIKDAGIHQLIREGYLAEFTQWIMDDKWTPENITRIYMEQPEKWGKSVIYFLNQEDAIECNQRLQDKGILSDCILGSTPNRDVILNRFKTGKVQVITNVAVLTEGFDEPSLKTAFVRPSSRGPTVQMAGRAFRKFEGIPIVNIVQNGETKFPFTRHARAYNQMIRMDGAWRSINAKNLQPIFQKQRLKIANAEITELPPFLKKQMKKNQIMVTG